jgi:hypothetical protein
MTPLLVVGVPRSGTTWVARILAKTLRAEVIDEPDNHFVSPYAFMAKRRLGHGNYPRLHAGDQAPEYGFLWRSAFGQVARGGTPGAQQRRALARHLLARERPQHVIRTLTREDRPRLGLRIAEILAVPEEPPRDAQAFVVKSVYAALSVDWIAELCSPWVVLVVRHPLNVLSSWLEMGWIDEGVLQLMAAPLRAELATRYGTPLPSRSWSAIAQAAWLCGALTCALSEAYTDLGTRTVVSHEQLCRRPREGFRAIAEGFRLPWSPDAERLLVELNRPGQGYETARVAEGLPDIWRRRLSRGQAREAMDALEPFPSDAWNRLSRPLADMEDS